MNNWERFLAKEVGPDEQLLSSPEWKVVDVWTLERSDGLVTAHKAESIHSGWEETVRDSVRLADKYIPIGAALPEGMRCREDPDYGPLWEREEEEEAK